MVAQPIDNPPSLDEWLDEPPDDGVAEEWELSPGWVFDARGEPEWIGVVGEQGDAIVEEPRKRWRIVSESGAVWAMRKLAAVTAECEAHAKTAQAEHDRIGAWLERVNGPLLAREQHFAFLLAEFHATFIDADLDLAGAPPVSAGPVDHDVWAKVKHKTLQLPTGTVKARRAAGTFQAAAPDVAVAFLEEHSPFLLAYNPKVSITKIEQGIAEGIARELPDGRFQMRVGAETLAEIDRVLETFPHAEFDAEERARLHEGAEPFSFDLWVTIPGIARTGMGLVTFTPKPEGT